MFNKWSRCGSVQCMGSGFHFLVMLVFMYGPLMRELITLQGIPNSVTFSVCR